MRESPRAMPEPDNLDLFLVRPQPVNDAIGAANDFAQVLLTEFRHAAADFREVCQTLGAGDQFVAKTAGGIGIVAGNVADDVRQI